MTPALRGTVRAVVTDTDDPSGAGRVQIALGLRARQRRVWAPVCMPFGVPTADLMTPAEGDQVVVAFEDDDPDRPIVMGRLGLPPRQQAGEVRLSHAGHSVVIDEAGITLELADGSTRLVLRPGDALLHSAASVQMTASGTCTIGASLVQLN